MPFSTKALDVRIVSTSAARQAARMFAAPAVKLIMAGTRPADITPKIVTAAPMALGNMTPMARPSGASGISLPPSTLAPMARRLKVSLPATGSSTATRLQPCSAPAASMASGMVRSIGEVAKAALDMMS